MTTRLYITSIEGVDKADDLLFRVEMFDSEAATVELKQTTHNAESWRDLADAVAKALDMMRLDKPTDPLPPVPTA